MASSSRDRMRERLKELLSADRLADVAAQVRIWKRNPDTGLAEPGELLPTVYGGKYDLLARRYVGAAEAKELRCHPGQLPLLLWNPLEKPGIMRVLALGTPGVGKTTALALKSLIEGLREPHLNIGMVTPTRDRRDVLWNEFLDIAQPLGWVEDVSGLKHIIRLKSGSVYYFVAAQRPSRRLGSPFQGMSWHRCFVDESQNVEPYAQRDIDERGRNAGGRYVVFESATNSSEPKWRERVEYYEGHPKTHAIIRLIGEENVFLPLGWWDRLKSQYTEREYRERIMLESLPPEQRIYPTFDRFATIRPCPKTEFGWPDITAHVAKEIYGRPAGIIIGHDPGVRTTYSVALKVFREPTTGERAWWAVNEWLSRGWTPGDVHARKIKARYHESEVTVQMDPHINTADVDKTDYYLFRKEGFDARPAWNGKIAVRHRIAMINALLQDASCKRRLFIDCDEDRKPRCPVLANALRTMTLPESGKLEDYRKDDDDQTHAPAALGYALFRAERIRGQSNAFEEITGEPTEAQSKQSERMARRMSRGYVS